MQPKDLLFILLRSALSGNLLKESEKEAVASALSEDTTRSLFTLSKKNDIAPLIAQAFEQNGFAVDALFEKEKLYALFRYENMVHELSAIKSTLSQEGIHFMPLKGAVLRRLYHEPYLRTSCDIDLLVKEKDLKAATDALVSTLSYKQSGDRNFHDISLYSAGGVHLELHHNILENIPALDRTLGLVWEHSAPIASESDEYAQSPAFLVFHIVAHMAYHFICGGCGIRPFADLYLLKKEHSYNDQELHELLKASSLLAFFDYACALCAVWFEGASHTKQTERMEAYLLEGGAYGSLKNSIAAKHKKSGKIRFILSRLFVSSDYLANLYPVLRRHKWLYPFMLVRRWVRLLFGGKLKNSVKEVQASQKISRADAERVTSLLNDIGLSL